MIALTGDTRSGDIVPKLIEHHIGRMAVRDTPAPYLGEPWGFDNGAFGYWLRKEPFDEYRFQIRLDRAYQKGTPYIAIVPDIVAGGEASLEFSLSWLDRLPPKRYHGSPGLG